MSLGHLQELDDLFCGAGSFRSPSAPTRKKISVESIGLRFGAPTADRMRYGPPVEPAYRGTPLVILRGWIRESPALEARVLDAMSPRYREAYHRLTAGDWVPLDFATQLFETASPLLRPVDPSPVRQIGHDIALEAARGVHRYLLRTLTVPFLLDVTGRLWPNYHRTGTATTERLGERLLRMDVVDYPELTGPIRISTAGYISALVEQTGIKDAAVQCGGSAQRWTWTVSWNK